jgi:hypothetical protein
MILLAAAALAAIFATLCVLAKFRVWGLILNPEIKPVELATLLVSAFIAFFLQYYLASRVTDRRAEKNLLIANLRDVLLALRSCRDTFISCYESGKITEESRRQILMLVRGLSNTLDTLNTAISMSRCSKLAEEYPHLMELYLNYKIALTGGKFPSKPYAADSFSDHDRTHRALNTGLQSLLFKINRHR